MFDYQFECLKEYIRQNDWCFKLTRERKKAFLLDYYLDRFLGIQLPSVAGEEFLDRDAILDVAMGQMMEYFPEEDVVSQNRMTIRFEEYRVNQIKEVYGLTFDQFIALPYYEVEERLRRQRINLSRERRETEMAKKRSRVNQSDSGGDFDFLDV